MFSNPSQIHTAVYHSLGVSDAKNLRNITSFVAAYLVTSQTNNTMFRKVYTSGPWTGTVAALNLITTSLKTLTRSTSLITLTHSTSLITLTHSTSLITLLTHAMTHKNKTLLKPYSNPIS